MGSRTQEITRRSRGARIALIIADSFVAATAIGDGIILVTGMESTRYPLDLLKGTAFSSYVIPGLVLALVVGGSAIVAAIAMLRSPYASAVASAAAGAVLMGWIAGEVLVLTRPSARSWVEALYFAIGLAMAWLGLVVGRSERSRQLPP